MTVLIYDTETTGLPVWGDPSNGPAQPHIVELSLGLFSDAGEEIDVNSWVVKPDGWTIPAETTAIHGIATDHAIEVGVPEGEAVQRYLLALDRASIRVAHNQSFDQRIMRIAMLRTTSLPREAIELLEARPSFDTCRKAAAFAKQAPTDRMMAAGIKTWKSPKLAECMEAFFGEKMTSAHDALADVRACARVYFYLKRLGVE